MILVTGTKRSGTSMWMQILVAAGFRPVGERYPRDWAQTLQPANPAGFWESKLREGIHHATNPDPETGAYVRPEQVRAHAVKVFIPGLVRTDLAYIDRVVVTVRHWRDYAASLARMRALEAQRVDPAPDPIPTLDPVVEWFALNFTLLGDLALRGYPARIVTYEDAADDPGAHVGAILDWLGASDPSAGVEAVRSELRTQAAPRSDDPVHPIGAACEQLYQALRGGGDLSPATRTALARAHARVHPQIREHEQALELRRLRRRLGAHPEPAS